MKRSAVALGISLVFALSASSQPGHLALSVRGDVVEVTGSSPGGDVVFFSIGSGSDGYTRLIRHVVDVQSDSDRDGHVAFRPSKSILPRSVWVAVDTISGQTAIGAPAGYRIKEKLGSRRLARGAQSRLIDEFDTPGGLLDVLYVHPVSGAWTGRIGDGQSLDYDGRVDGKVQLRLADLKAFSPGKERPPDFGPGGVLVTIDRYTMQVYASRVDALLGEVRP